MSLIDTRYTTKTTTVSFRESLDTTTCVDISFGVLLDPGQTHYFRDFSFGYSLLAHANGEVTTETFPSAGESYVCTDTSLIRTVRVTVTEGTYTLDVWYRDAGKLRKGKKTFTVVFPEPEELITV
jgi:hypothetical protein